jgi:hypothetical protein
LEEGGILEADEFRYLLAKIVRHVEPSLEIYAKCINSL